MHTRGKLGRRTLLAAATGLGGASLILPSLLRSRAVRAADPVIPRRIIFFYTAHGMQHAQWRMHPAGMSLSNDWEYPLATRTADDFSHILKPLHPWRERLLILDGLCMLSALEDDISQNLHHVGTIHSLTGAPMVLSGAEPTASAASLDQILAQSIGGANAFPSLEFGVGTADNWNVSFSGASTPLPIEYSPMEAFNRLFGDATAMTSDATRIRQAQGSVLDLVASEYEQLVPKLSPTDRAKLELHRDLVRDLETRTLALAQISCDEPAAPVLDSNKHAYVASYEAFVRLVSVALACQMTRVVSIQLQTMPPEVFGAPVGDDVHQAYAHAAEYSGLPGYGPMGDYHQKSAEMFATLLSTLAAVPEGGGSLLDSTLCVWLGELATGNHQMAPWTVVIAGGSNSGFNLGRYVWYKQLHTSPAHPLGTFNYDFLTGNGSYVFGPPHNKFLVSLAQAMGHDTQQVGQATMQSSNGTTVSLTGALPRLV